MSIEISRAYVSLIQEAQDCTPFIDMFSKETNTYFPQKAYKT